METSEELFVRMKAAAIELNLQNEFGALHIFVSDGNCEDESLVFCLEQPDITESERDFATRMLEQFTEDSRFGIYALAQCPDTYPLSHSST